MENLALCFKLLSPGQEGEGEASILEVWHLCYPVKAPFSNCLLVMDLLTPGSSVRQSGHPSNLDLTT